MVGGVMEVCGLENEIGFGKGDGERGREEGRDGRRDGD